MSLSPICFLQYSRPHADVSTPAPEARNQGQEGHQEAAEGREQSGGRAHPARGTSTKRLRDERPQTKPPTPTAHLATAQGKARRQALHRTHDFLIAKTPTPRHTPGQAPSSLRTRSVSCSSCPTPSSCCSAASVSATPPLLPVHTSIGKPRPSSAANGGTAMCTYMHAPGACAPPASRLGTALGGRTVSWFVSRQSSACNCREVARAASAESITRPSSEWTSPGTAAALTSPVSPARRAAGVAWSKCGFEAAPAARASELTPPRGSK
eukprot:scaffold36277_cov117-Isochrysis_galbana.AAC.7